MNFFQHLYSYMASNPNIKEIFGGKIYPGVSPKETSYPILIYNNLGTIYDKNLQKESGFIKQKVQFTVVDSTYAKASLNGEVVRSVFKDFKGDMAGMNIGATHFETHTVETVETNEYMAVLEVEFWYEN